MKLHALYKYIMKKFLKVVLSVVFCLSSICPINSFAVNEENIQWYENNFTEEKIQQILDQNPQNNVAERATGLIKFYNVAIAKDGSYLAMVARVICDGEVVKCGFKKIVLQQRATTSSSWKNCLTLEKIYDDNFGYTIGRTFAVNSGYQYRVVCTFYAKKNLLVTEKIEHTSNVVTF